MEDYTIEELKNMIESKEKEERFKNNNIDYELNLNFSLEDLIQYFTLHRCILNDDGSKTEIILPELLDDNNFFKMDVFEKYAEKYINQNIKDSIDSWTDKDYIVDNMDKEINISWNVKVKSIKSKGN